MSSDESVSGSLEAGEAGASPLTEFCYCLGSFSTISEPGIADQANTREEAELLMGLSTPVKLTKAEREELVPKTESLVVPRHSFSFTCPSLSLEPIHKFPVVTKSRRVSNEREPTDSASMLLPAELLGRPLKVDDRHALRLSADAMGRNVLNTFQKAMRWRICQWQNQCRNALICQERELRCNGLKYEDIQQQLMDSPEARVLSSLKGMEPVEVHSAGTAFRVTESDDVKNQEQGNKRQRTGRSRNVEFREDVHQVLMDCHISFEASFGHAEVDLEVPGTMSSNTSLSEGYEDLVSVKVDIDTAIFAAMIERSCRKIVRASVEHVLKNATFTFSEAVAAPSKTKAVESPFTLSSPVPQVTVKSWSNIITPKTASDSDSEVECNQASSSCLMQLPDRLSEGPRRISPQPGSPQMSSSLQSTLSCLKPRVATSKAASLITPPQNYDKDYQTANRNSPSLPLLVEAACLAMESK